MVKVIYAKCLRKPIQSCCASVEIADGQFVCVFSGEVQPYACVKG